MLIFNSNIKVFMNITSITRDAATKYYYFFPLFHLVDDLLINRIRIFILQYSNKMEIAV